MQITDIKIKNLVGYKDDTFVVTEIYQSESGKYLVKIQNGHKVLSVPSDDITPVTINEEWLNKLGFSKTYSSDLRIRYERPESYIKYDIDLSSRKIVEGLKIYGNTIKCKYIHEFQNILSSLFGKDIFTNTKNNYSDKVFS